MIVRLIPWCVGNDPMPSWWEIFTESLLWEVVQPGVLLLASHLGRRLELWASEPPFFSPLLSHTGQWSLNTVPWLELNVAFFLVFKNLFGRNFMELKDTCITWPLLIFSIPLCNTLILWRPRRKVKNRIKHLVSVFGCLKFDGLRCTSFVKSYNHLKEENTGKAETQVISYSKFMNF